MYIFDPFYLPKIDTISDVTNRYVLDKKDGKLENSDMWAGPGAKWAKLSTRNEYAAIVRLEMFN